MPQQNNNREIRVFLSSAFRDMDSGRTYLVNQVSPTGMADAAPDNETAMPVSLIPTFPRKRGKGRTNRCAMFHVKGTQCAGCASSRIL